MFNILFRTALRRKPHGAQPRGGRRKAAFEILESRAMMSASPLAASAVLGHAAAAANSTKALASYMVGTWINDGGDNCDIKQVWRANGTYVTQENYRLNAYDIPYHVPWYTVDTGMWKAMVGTPQSGELLETSTFKSYRGFQDVVYVSESSRNLADIGVRPASDSIDPPVWMFYGRMV